MNGATPNLSMTDEGTALFFGAQILHGSFGLIALSSAANADFSAHRTAAEGLRFRSANWVMLLRGTSVLPVGARKNRSLEVKRPSP
ncbi:uncharacterized protein TRAVEDRAFT_44384 [Trametes versicolor FP-101664 SS1]|uniref:uncharacterized protein n=1 Tax=Trametes versicolor (strain FP-101664) TaxID=717944 RepID=UPI00046221F1|nr:uncharacterized protein TRAVEDRAFT_44384 [Trametes versicolor FP-101664 SS1]EIW61563.1 hypothetical protein TRAVEDRAFT_44384 [Trametes versicolor FP-101664 SS1]